jgi:hypothetical protein
MNYAYTPAFDFDPKEADMKFEEIMALVSDPTKTHRQIAADLEAAFIKASQPSALNIKPKQERKKREARQPKQPALNGFAVHAEAPDASDAH